MDVDLEVFVPVNLRKVNHGSRRIYRRGTHGHTVSLHALWPGTAPDGPRGLSRRASQAARNQNSYFTATCITRGPPRPRSTTAVM